MTSVWGLLRRNYLILNPPVAPKQDGALRFGILGAAKIAPIALITPAKSHPEVVIQAVAARDAGRAAAFAAKHGIPEVKPDYQAVLDDPAIDCVYIPLPNGLHYEWALRALEAGKHVLLEKPSVANAREAEALFRSPLLLLPLSKSHPSSSPSPSSSSSLVLLEAFHYRFQPSWQLFLTLVDAASVEHVRARTMMPWFAIPDDGDIRFRYGLAGGGLMDLGTYAVSAIRQTFAREAEECLDAAFRTMPPPEDKADYAWRVTWRMEGGGTAEAEGSFREGLLGMGVPRLSVTHRETRVEDGDGGGSGSGGSRGKGSKSGELPAGQEKTRRRRIEFVNFMVGAVWHRIDVVDEFVVRRTGTGEVVRRWTEKTARKAYTFREAGLEGVGEEHWITYRHQLEQFVNRVRGRETPVWVDGEDSIAQMRMIDMAYEKAGLPLRKSPGVTI